MLTHGSGAVAAPDGSDGGRREPRITPLTGGVSSDIHLVEMPGRRFCVKRALPRLKVAAVWEAPVGRNAAEAAWMRVVGGWLPGAAPAMLGEDPGAGLFAMAYLPPDGYPVWKAELMEGRVDPSSPPRSGGDLARSMPAAPAIRRCGERFANDATFEAIRIEPYLRATGRAHPDLAPRFERARRLDARDQARPGARRRQPQEHPARPDGPVFLDAECACYGDPAFDLAFCLNHLLLKGARTGADRAGYPGALRGARRAPIRPASTGKTPSALEARAAALLPALFLARVDGKSPVEYLDARRREGRGAPLRAAAGSSVRPPSRPPSPPPGAAP